jgi:predicted amidohydrolase YtcJ
LLATVSDVVDASSHPHIALVILMPSVRWRFILGAISIATWGCSSSRNKEPSEADAVFLDGNIITVDANDRIAQAVAVKNGRIIAVGSNRDMQPLVGPLTLRIGLNGLTLTPGLLDAHAHFASSGVDRLRVVDLSYPEVKSVADVVTKVRAQAARVGPTDWIEGRGWDEGKLSERRYITARDLDPATGEHPAYLTQTTGHYGVANSAALKLAGITKDTPDPPNGTIDRYPDGTPTGVLKESAQRLVRRLVPPRQPGQIEEGIREMANAFNREGMTGAKDPGIDTITWNAYKKVLADTALSVRIFALWRGGTTVDGAKALIARAAATTKPYESTGDDHLISGGVKLYIDGSGGARTAWLYDDWNKDFTGVDVGNKGYPASNPDTIRLLIKMFHDAGFHVAVHAIGDRGIDWVVDSYAEALKANPAKGRRHAIIHSNIPTNHALDTMAELERTYDAAYPEPSATFAWWIGDTYAGNFGEARSKRLNPFKTYLSKGIRWGNGSDYNVTPFAARYALWSAIAREPLLGVYGTHPFGTDESVDIHTALKSVTIWAAQQMFLEKKIGSIEVGKYADLAVWDRDPYTVQTAQLKDMECLLTMFNGRVVYSKPNTPLSIFGGRPIRPMRPRR